MNSCNTDIFFSNYYHWQSVRFEFRLQYEDDYEYEFSVLSTRSRFKGRTFSKCACSELKTRTRGRPRTPI